MLTTVSLTDVDVAERDHTSCFNGMENMMDV